MKGAGRGTPHLAFRSVVARRAPPGRMASLVRGKASHLIVVEDVEDAVARDDDELVVGAKRHRRDVGLRGHCDAGGAGGGSGGRRRETSSRALAPAHTSLRGTACPPTRPSSPIRPGSQRARCARTVRLEEEVADRT